MTWGRLYWPIFLCVVSIAFLAAEGYALATNDYNTLSWYAWTELQLPTSPRKAIHTAAWFLSQGAFIVTALWLWRHVWYQQYR